ncbi:MAG: SDR family oxidoreductase [Chloroflexota bacterium]|nr:SDR family oxidoreductase [Chloroflexota bacterium]
MRADVLASATTQARDALLDLERLLGRIGDADLHRANSEGGWTCVNVNAISPGATQTEIPRETVTREVAHQFVEGQAVKRPETPEDLVGTVVFLASGESDFITGRTINIDDGMRCH